MKRKSKKGFFAIMTIPMFTCVLLVPVLLQTTDASLPAAEVAAADSDPVPGSCTMFTASFGDTVLYGNNEDYMRTLTYYWVRLPGKDTYGGVYLGHYSEEEIRSRGGHSSHRHPSHRPPTGSLRAGQS